MYLNKTDGLHSANLLSSSLSEPSVCHDCRGRRTAGCWNENISGFALLAPKTRFAVGHMTSWWLPFPMYVIVLLYSFHSFYILPSCSAILNWANTHELSRSDAGTPFVKHVAFSTTSGCSPWPWKSFFSFAENR